jgi:hypothetical protein
VLGVAALGVAVWDVTMGGFHYRILGLRVSSWEAYKPLRLGVTATAAAFWLRDRTAEPTATTWHLLPRWTAVIAAVIALFSVAVAMRYGIFAAGGADAYGYVSQASLWATRGGVVAPDPFAALEPELGAAVAPLGYRLAQTPGAIVPIYPPGLPLTMAVALKLGSAGAVYYVVPLLGALALWLTYRLGARVDRPVTGMMAAIFVAFSPIFMFQTLEPMSDVPVTAWWLLAWLLALTPGWPAALGAGFAVSAAVLTRPNIVPLAIVIAVLVTTSMPRVMRVAVFAAASIPSCLIVAALNARLYGSPLSPGYGPLEGIYVLSRWKVNLLTYGGWLITLHSPGILIAFLAPVATRVRHSVAMVSFFLVLFACYLWYIPFATWPFVRFLLPAIPLLFILSSAVVVRGVEMLPVSLRTAAVFVVCTLVPASYLSTSESRSVFEIQRAEHRYVAVGRYIGRTLPPNVVVLSQIQSGSMRLYGGRLTLRWDMFDPKRLDAAVETLRANGYYPYLLIEDWELPAFRDQFGSTSQYGRVDWPPAFVYRDEVRIYDFADRARHLERQPIATRTVPLDE